MENDFSLGCSTIFGTFEKELNSAMLSPAALWLGNVLQTGVTGHIATTLEGVGDGASFGLTGLVRNWISPGSECFVKKDGF